MKKVAPMAVSAPVANPAYAPASDSAAQQQALEVLRARQSGKAAPAVVSTPRPTAKPADMRPPAAVAVSTPMTSPAYTSPSDSAAQKQALEVLRARQSDKATPAMGSTPNAMAQPPAKPAYIAPSPSAAQLQAMEVLRSKQSGTAKSPTQISKIAATPIPAMAPTTKEGKLAELTRRYLNDEITPREYHTQRAKILAD